MHSDQPPSFLAGFKWHILLVAVVVVPVVSFIVLGDNGTGVGGVSSALLYCGAAILLGAILIHAGADIDPYRRGKRQQC